MIKKLSTTLLALVLVFSACKKEQDNNDEPNTGQSFNLQLSKTEAAPYEYITFELPEGKEPVSINAKYTELTIGTTVANAFRYYPEDAKAGHYYFQLMIPEMAPASYKITMKSPQGDLTADITVKALAQIADANVYIATLQDDFSDKRDEAADKYADQVKAGTLKQSTADSLINFIDEAAKKSKDLVTTLSDEEKKVYAYLMQSNKAWLDEYLAVMSENPMMSKTQGDCEDLETQALEARDEGRISDADNLELQARECKASREQARLAAGNRYRARISAAYEEAKMEKDNTPGKVKGAWAFVSTFVTAAGKGLIEEATGIKDLSDPFGLKSLEEVGNKAGELFIEGEARDLSAGVLLINASNDNKGFSEDFAMMVNSMENYNEVMDDIGQFLPYVPHIDIPSSQQEKLFVSGYTISDISNPKIKVQVIEGGKGKQVKFTADGLSDPLTSFTFKLTVKGKYGEVSKTVDAQLQLPLDKVLVGGSPWKITYLNVDGEDQFKFQKRGNVICAGTTYWDEYRILSATMSFTAGHGGSLNSQGELKTHNTSGQGDNCTYLGSETNPENNNSAITWTFDPKTEVIKIPELVNDDVDEYKVTYSGGVVTLKSLYVEIRLVKP